MRIVAVDGVAVHVELLERARAGRLAWLSSFGNPEISEQAIGFGLADQEELDLMGAVWHTWGERPDAVLALPLGEAVGHVR